MKTIELGCFGLILEVDKEGVGAIVASELKETCCHDKGCDGSCLDLYNAAMDGVESLILAHACAGLDVTDPAYLEGIETAVCACDQL